MKKIRLFSAKATKGIEGEEAELYVNFYLVLNRNYIFTFLIDSPNLSCSDRHPIKLWKHFLILFEEEYVKYMRRYEKAESELKKMSNTIDVIITSHLNFDGFDIGNKSYKLDQLDALRSEIGNRKINWVRGVNIFANRKPVSDKFMQLMIDRYNSYIAENS